MVISDDFVFLHAPKTGGTFLTEVLTEVYTHHLQRRLICTNKHGGVERIPPEHRAKQRVTIVRHPFDYYASHYRFGYWINRPWDSIENGRPLVRTMPCFWDDDKMRRLFSNYPYLSFEQYLDGALHFNYGPLSPDNRHLADRLRLGPATVSALFYSVPDYLLLLEQLVVDHDLTHLKRQVAQTRILHTECLNQDTYRWLLELRIPPEVAEVALHKQPVKPLNTPDGKTLERAHGQPRNTHWSALFSERAKAWVVEYEWLIFELFPEYSWATEVAPPKSAWRQRSTVNSGQAIGADDRT